MLPNTAAFLSTGLSHSEAHITTTLTHCRGYSICYK